MSSPLRLGALGIGPFAADGDLCREAEAGIRSLATRGAALVLLPELFAAPFFAGDDPVRWQHVAEDLEGPICGWARRVSTETGSAIVFGMALLAPDGATTSNAVILAVPGEAPRLVQRKVHLAPPGGEAFGEEDHFAAGPAEIGSFVFRGIRFSALVCYDRRFPECWRAAGRQGADVVLVLVGGPANDPPGLFEAEIRTHARANAVYALASSRFGSETVTGRHHHHDGATLAADPEGALLPAGEHDVLLEFAPALLERARANNPTHRKLRLDDRAHERTFA